jgi:hypothetical protein
VHQIFAVSDLYERGLWIILLNTNYKKFKQDDHTILHGERVFLIVSYICYPELMSVMSSWHRDHLDMRVKYCIFIARVYLKQVLQRVDITDDDLVHEGNQEVL